MVKMAEETPLARFAAHLQRDQAAVLAAMQLPWSNGHVEGQVHRLKLIKRQMSWTRKVRPAPFTRVLYAA